MRRAKHRLLDIDGDHAAIYGRVPYSASNCHLKQPESDEARIPFLIFLANQPHMNSRAPAKIYQIA